MISDIEIAKKSKMKPITDIAKNLDINYDDIELYGKYKAKLSNKVFKNKSKNKDGKLILVTAINPTPLGEGKTTITIGIGQALNKIGKKSIVTLREPSLGPVFGIKGGAAGGGYSQVLPMEDINLHFTGDMHAITTANNLISCCIDNHLHQGNSLNIDPRKILFKRCLDLNDRAMRFVNIGLGGYLNSIPREDNFQITVASEIMAILCLSNDLEDLKQKVSNILIAYTYNEKPIFLKDLNIQGAVTTLLKDAINPNLIQTIDNTPAIMHGGPFANIAHGCNSIRATKISLKLADYTITEAGFGADLGAEKFLDIKCRYAGLSPNCIVIVATIKALKYNAGIPKEILNIADPTAVKKGIVNLVAHIENMKKYGVPVLVALNKYSYDSNEEIDILIDTCQKLKCEYSICEVFEKGSKGGIDIANKIVELCDTPSNFKPLYDLNLSIEEKINIISKNIYGASSVILSEKAKKSIKKINELKFNTLPICIAKTQYSLSDNPNLLGRPSNFNINVSDIRLSAGAGFIVVYTGDIMTMPGLPKIPAANSIDINENGEISGLF